MHRYGYLSLEEKQAHQEQDIVLSPNRAKTGRLSPYFSEHVRLYLSEKYGEDSVLNKGLVVETTLDPIADDYASHSVQLGSRKQDKRQGWRGPIAHLDSKSSQQLFLERSAKLYERANSEKKRRYLALITDVTKYKATIHVGEKEYTLGLSDNAWMSRWSAGEEVDNDKRISSFEGILMPGDVVWVKPKATIRAEYDDWFLAGPNPRWMVPTSKNADQPLTFLLDQPPHPQVSLFSADHHSGYIVSMIGGTDFSRSEYNRTTQACRQPASTFKPIYYSKALEMGYGFDTALNDVTRGEVDETTGEIWTPENLGGTQDVKVSLEYALVFSKNVPSVDVFKKVGTKRYEEWAKKLGFTTDLVPGDCHTKTCTALALGAPCTYLDELTRAFALFARNGKWIEWIPVKRVMDRSGNVLEDNAIFDDPTLRASRRLDRIVEYAANPPKQNIPARPARLMTNLLRKVITHGFSAIVRQTGIVAAGKTGTSSSTMDTSFVGFTPRWITSVWMGDDKRVRTLGINDAAFMTAVPIWAHYMVHAAKNHPKHELPHSVPDGASTKDRGDHSLGKKHKMPLIYLKHDVPEETDLSISPLIPVL